MKNVINVIAVLCLVVAFNSCYNDKADKVYPATNTGPVTCDTTNVTYSGKIMQIFTLNCNLSGCHDGGTPAAIYNFTTYAGVVQAITNDRLLGAIEHESGYQQMPQTGALSSCDIDQIKIWVNNGNPNN